MEDIKDKEIIEFFKSGQSFKDVAYFLLQKAKGVEGASLKFNSYYEPREDAGGSSQEYVLRIPSVS